jgi:nucleotidyltransferase substrate binding protein (TIGR01987 family)
MTDPKLQDSLNNLANALQRLREALAVPADQPLAVDGTIQRFEFVVEVCWKTLKRALAYEGIETATPREAIVQAFAARLIDDETAWLDMLRDRNLTAHLYDEAMALGIYQRIRAHFTAIEAAYQTLVERWPES